MFSTCSCNSFQYIQVFRDVCLTLYIFYYFQGPTLSVWYKTLTKIVPADDKFLGLKKMALDQIPFAPVFLLSIITLINTMEGLSFQETKEQLRLKYKDILFANWKVWPIVQTINFYFVPYTHQVAVAQFVAIFWNTYLSYKTSQGKVTGDKNKGES